MYKIKLHKKELSPLGYNMIVKGLLMLFIIAGALHSASAQGIIMLEQQTPPTEVIITATEQVILKPGFHAIGSAGTFNAKIGSENSMSPIIPMATGSTAVIQNNPIIPITPAVPSLGQNYIVSTVAYKEVTDATALNETNSNTSIQYFDGLGRPSQTVQHAITPLGADLVSGIEYDGVGRDFRHWLPGAVAGNGGAYVSDFGEKAKSTNGGDAKPYVETILESSPLNRPLGQHQPGADWYTHPTGIDYKTNDAGEVIYFSVENNQLKRNGNYDPNTLYKTVVTDEDKKTTTEYKDKQGQVVMKRSSGDVDTYYVYNDLNQLSYVIPPKAVDELTDFSDDNAILKQYCYLYQYDERGNCIYKRLPGCTPIYMVYDKADRLVLSQDGNQRKRLQGASAQWTVTKYDSFGRAVFTGLMYRNEIDSTQNYKSIRDIVSNVVVTESYAGFSTATPLTINHYDNYNFIPAGNNLSYDSSQEQNGYTAQYSSAKGLLTGTAVYRLNDPTKFETTALYYDKYGRVVQSRATNHLLGYDITYNKLDFRGKVSKSRKEHNISGQAVIPEVYRYAYDKAERLTLIRYKLGANDTITLASNSYDELGRLITQKRHTNADTETFAYNIRNWMTNITSGGFTENLYYNANPLNSNATYNGNISYSTWTYNGATKGYLYDYDGLNRLLSANFKQVSSGLGDDSFNEAFTYDKMGNILTLKRKKNYTQIDDLVFHYSNNEKSNQLQYVDDGGATQNQYLIKEYQNKSTAQAEFTYDANGNMTKDLDREIYTIKYNVLNLPDVIQFKNGNQIKNTYNAGGQKLGTEYFTWLPGANAPVVNTGDVLNISYSQGAVDQDGTVYIGNVEYNTKNGNSSLTAISRIHNTEGYVENISSPNYYYYRKDHLGNNREVWLANTNTTKQWTQYYPSGLPWVTTSNDNLSTQPYKYNGKEFVEMHGYDTYDYGARGYYPAGDVIPTVDPLCEKHPEISPYVYCAGNPVRYVDPDGRDFIVLSMNNGNQELRRIKMDGEDRYYKVNEDAFNNASKSFTNDNQDYNTMLSIGSLRTQERNSDQTGLIAEQTGVGVSVSGSMRDGNNLIGDVQVTFQANFDDNSNYSISSYNAVAGGYGNGAPENGDYTVNNYQDRSPSGWYSSGMNRDGVGFSYNLNPQFNTGRSDLRVHPDGNNEGTLGCIGLTGNAQGITDFRNTLNGYLQNRSSLPVNINITNNPNNNGRNGTRIPHVRE
jgi:RHS repeat-associated protein